MSRAILERPAVVRAALETELPACRMLLPEAFAWGTSPDFVLATAQNPLRFLGAAAFTVGRRRVDGRPLMKIAMRVPAPHRRRGVGTRLLHHLDDAARRRGIEVISAIAGLPEQGAWADFLAARGFAPAQRLHTFDADVRRMSAHFSSRRDWLAGHGKIPSRAEVVSLREAPRRQIAELFAAQLGGMDDQVEACLRAVADRLTSNLGHAVMLDGAVQAALYHRREEKRVAIEALAVSPSLQTRGTRAGWAHMLVTASAFEWYVSNGIERARYAVSASNRMVMKQYLRFDPDEIEVREFYERTIK